MSLSDLVAVCVAVLAAGYFGYGRFVARRLGLDDARVTPAHLQEDGVDFMPTRPGYLLGQHFSAIAAAGPIAGPIIACQQFGWLPCVLWITLGVVFIGAVHDLSALVASVRHQARSVAEIVKENLGPRAWLFIMAFIWIALVYVIVAFADLTAGTFVGRIEELEGVKLVAPFNQGGAVAFASIAYLLLAMAMGVVQKRFNPPLWLLTVLFVPATLGVVWLGTQVDTLFALGGTNPQKLWGVLILGYCFVASLLPVWLLLQPRGYLGGYLLYLALAIGVIGILFGGFKVEQPKWRAFDAGGPTGVLFPFLFVTIACGACSGFHGLVCSGTTSKQIAKETHCRAVGYGAMLLEGFVAVIALATVMIALPAKGTPPGRIYGDGIATFLTLVIGKDHLLFAKVFGSMVFSTFVFDTIDVAARLGRYILQELFGWRGRAGAAAATALTVCAPLLFILAAEPAAPGKQPAYMAYWTLFGTSNQLLAALTLLGISVWLRRSGRAAWFTLAPMVFVMAVTTAALGLQVRAAWLEYRGADGALNVTVAVNGAVATALLVLTGLFVVEAARALRAPRPVASA